MQVDIYGRRDARHPRHSTPSLSPAGRALQRQHSGDAIDMMLEGERDDYEEDTELFRKSYDVRVWYREA